MVITVDFLLDAIPIAISAISACIAGAALVANKILAKKQAYFDRKAAAYENFWCATSAVAHDPFSADKRGKILEAYFCANLYMPEDLYKEAGFLVEKLLTARTDAQIVALDEVAPEFVEYMKRDLRKIW